MRYFFSVTLFALVLISTFIPTHAQTVGFIDGLWLSTDSPTANQSVRIYAAIRNQVGTEITGDIEFYIDDTLLVSKPVTALDGRIIEAWTDWLPKAGSYRISAQLTNLTAHNQNQTTQSLSSATQVSKQIQVTDPEPPSGTNPTSHSSTSSSTDIRSTDYTQGLEQFLRPSRAETLLRHITDWASSTEKQLANYQTVPADRATVTVNTLDNNAEETPVATTSDMEVWDKGKNLILHILRWPLQHPAVLQLALLIGSIIGILRVARYFGGRP